MHENPTIGAQVSDIGIVVIGRNEGERLVKCLQSVRAQTKWLVYVDSGSTDGSPDTAQRLGAHVVMLDLNRPFTAARARNQGAEALRIIHPGVRFVQFVDGDCELNGDWLTIASDFLTQHDDIAVACGRRRERHPSISIYNRLCNLEWDTPVGQALACGGDSLMRWTAFQEAGGFAEGLIAGEEPELCLRLRARGWKIWRLDAEMTAHDAALTRFQQWWIRCSRGGHAMAEVAALHWHEPEAIWKKELFSAVFWGFVAPMLILILSFSSPVGFASLLIYPIQIIRIAIRRGPGAADSWLYALFVILGKFAEFQGAATYYWRLVTRQSPSLIEYK